MSTFFLIIFATAEVVGSVITDMKVLEKNKLHKIKLYETLEASKDI